MATQDRIEFVARTLQSPTGLDGCFRVHVSQDHLEAIGVDVGQLCEISADKDGTTVLGYGIAWRALDKMGNSPRLRPARMTDVLRNAFGIQEGSHVYLGPAKRDSILRAEKVVLSDVTPKDYSKTTKVPSSEEEQWLLYCISTLVHCEAFANGQTFEVSSRNRTKKRFCIENIEATGTQQGVPSLFYITDRTQFQLGDSYGSRPSSAVNGESNTMLTTERIGGLLEQVQKLNGRVARVLRQYQTLPKSHNQGILIHGYEGTGKSLLLKQLESLGSIKTIRIDKSRLNKGTMGKNREAIITLFEQAVKSQPSLVLMDDLGELAPRTGEGCADTIVSELDKLERSRVLVIAACRTPSEVNDKLIGPGRLTYRIELSIPDASARAAILSVVLDKEDDPTGSIVENVSFRTHGFTGKDLALLVETAYSNRLDRLEQQTSMIAVSQNGSLAQSMDGATHSQAVAAIEVREETSLEDEVDSNTPVSRLNIGDFDFALTEVRPTALREVIFEKPQIDWSSIGGSLAIKERFDEIIGWPLHAADKLARQRVPSEKGVLLYGPPGCSKTLTAQAVANHYDLNFIVVKGGELISMYVGESERAIREVFRKARAAAPCVIFFDEIDSIASERDSAGTKGLNVLTTLLNEMDGFESLKGVLVLAATNKPDALDPAIMRPGRFDSHIYLGPPNAAARKEIFAINTTGIQVLGEIDLDELSEATEGYSGAEIVSICNSAKKQSIRRDLKNGEDTGVSMADLKMAIETTSKGISEDMLLSYASFVGRIKQASN